MSEWLGVNAMRALNHFIFLFFWNCTMTSVWSWDEDGSGLRTGGGGWWRMVKAEKGGLEGWVGGCFGVAAG